ncbi:MAG: Hsp70 family protein [Eubacterium sp.]
MEVTFDIDANGIVNVSARTLEQVRNSITITAGSNMSDEDIDKAVRKLLSSRLRIRSVRMLLMHVTKLIQWYSDTEGYG